MEAQLSPTTVRQMRLILFGAAVVGILTGVSTLLLHITHDPLVDVHAYYDAGARLNSGLPLYPVGADTNAPDFYRYPPLLAIAFRPLALMPFPLAAALWETLVLGSFAFTVWRLGRRESTWIAIGILATPIVWSLVIGQAQVPVTALLLVSAPWAVALAAHLKLLPALVALYWLGRREWSTLGRFVVWAVALGLLQLIVEPAGTIAFLSFPSLGQVGEVINFSPFVVSPVLWAALVVFGVGLTLYLAPTRWGWPAAIALSVLASPRLLTYQLMTLLAGLRSPDRK